MTRILEVLDDFKLNQQIQVRKPRYVEMSVWRMMKWKDFMREELGIEEVEKVRSIYLKRYIQYRQQLGQ